MTTILRFPRHARASADSTGSAAAKASNVMCEQPFSAASRTMAAHRPEGMPRVRHVLTVEAGRPSPADTAPVPPRSSIAESGVSMEQTIVRRLRTSQEFATVEQLFLDDYDAIPAMVDSARTLGKRLATTRKALGFKTQVAFCKEIGIEKNVYNPFEKGRRPITIEVALKIHGRFGVSLDWIYCGEPRHLSVDLYQKLVAAA